MAAILSQLQWFKEIPVLNDSLIPYTLPQLQFTHETECDRIGSTWLILIYWIQKDYCFLQKVGLAKVLHKVYINSSGCHFAVDMFRCIFFNEKFCILIKFSKKFVCKGPIDNNSALVQVMAWHREGYKPLPEPIQTKFTDAYLQHYGEMS